MPDNDETPAQVLRRTAGLMRERLAELPPSPWRAEGRDVTATQDYEADGAWDWGRGYVVAACPRQDEAEHVAAWGPPAALAVAEWLESRARDADDAIAAPGGTWDLSWCDDPPGIEWGLKVARAYLGETPGHPVTATGGKDGDEEEGSVKPHERTA